MNLKLNTQKLGVSPDIALGV